MTTEEITVNANKMVDFLKNPANGFDFSALANYDYTSLPICIIDCVYSLRAKYDPTTLNVVNRYATLCMNGNKYDSGDTVTKFINYIDSLGANKFDVFADELGNHQKLAHILKSEISYNLAVKFKEANVETISDFQSINADMEQLITSVKGLGDAAKNYMFMLAGDPDRCKPDVHINHFIMDACSCRVTDQDCQNLFTEAVNIFKSIDPIYSGLTVRQLDYIVWNKYQINDLHNISIR